MAVQLKDKSGNNIEPKAPSKVGYINIKNPQTLENDKEYTATTNGWVHLYANTGDDEGGAYIRINGLQVFDCSNIKGWKRYTFPVKSGQKYSVLWQGTGGDFLPRRVRCAE